MASPEQAPDQTPAQDAKQAAAGPGQGAASGPPPGKARQDGPAAAAPEAAASEAAPTGAAPTGAAAGKPEAGGGGTDGTDGHGTPPPGDETDTIHQEGLTPRQLRMARRIARKHGLAPTSDLDAVRLLRKRGIDPFARRNLLDTVVRTEGGTNLPAAPANTALTAEAPPLPAPSTLERELEVLRVQRDIARRRRRRLALMAARILVFVLLPTFLAGWYFYRIATPMYAVKSEFFIQKAEAGGMGGRSGGIGGLFAGTSFATSQDSIAVQGYLQSLAALRRLDADKGFLDAFRDPAIDPLQRLPADASEGEAYRLYKRHVRVSYDTSEGVVRLEVIAPRPEQARDFSAALISYAEEQVDQMTERLREDQMAGARRAYEEAERKMLEAQRRVVELQEKRGIFSAQGEAEALMSQIQRREMELQNARLELETLLDNPRPNEVRVRAVKGEIERLEKLVAELRARLTTTGRDNESLARISAELMTAQAELETRQEILAQAAQQLELARLEANRQVRYLSQSVPPVAPAAASYPRAFENTLLAFLVFGGIYLLVSITVSILREQVSA